MARLSFHAMLETGGTRLSVPLRASSLVQMTRLLYRATPGSGGVGRVAGTVRLSMSVAIEDGESLHMMMMTVMMLLTAFVTMMRKLWTGSGGGEICRLVFPLLICVVHLDLLVVLRSRSVLYDCDGETDFDGRIGLQRVVCYRTVLLLHRVDADRRRLGQRVVVVEGWCRHPCRHRLVH